ncbi:MAG: hypothetical protein EB828_01680 [Nitrosopumilus sp. D6]|nr:MAG: hypothetical protein EB828_01680 [Nitrosopumilus sp. D6]
MRIRTIIIHDGAGVHGLGDKMAESLVALSAKVIVRDWQDMNAESARIYDTKVPFERQPESGISMPLYDGTRLQGIMSGIISEAESGMETLHVMFLDKLACTFDHDDYRYHARALIASNPAIVSMPGIVEAPARPKQYHVDMACYSMAEIEARYAGEYLRAGDPKIVRAAEIYLMQAVMYHETGEAFCADSRCRLYNAHWQSELLSQIGSFWLCKKHQTVLESM